MQTQTVKEQVRQAVEEFPDDVSFEEAMERIYLRHIAERERAEAGEDDAANDEEAVHEVLVSSTISTTIIARSWRSSDSAGAPA